MVDDGCQIMIDGDLQRALCGPVAPQRNFKLLRELRHIGLHQDLLVEVRFAVRRHNLSLRLHNRARAQVA